MTREEILELIRQAQTDLIAALISNAICNNREEVVVDDLQHWLERQ